MCILRHPYYGTSLVCHRFTGRHVYERGNYILRHTLYGFSHPRRIRTRYVSYKVYIMIKQFTAYFLRLLFLSRLGPSRINFSTRYKITRSYNQTAPLPCCSVNNRLWRAIARPLTTYTNEVIQHKKTPTFLLGWFYIPNASRTAETHSNAHTILSARRCLR